MKIVIGALVGLIATSWLSGCSNGSNDPAGSVTPPPPVTINGLDTPKSVSVVTAN